MDYAISKNNHKIRLTTERWFHITEGHSEIAGYFFEILEAIQNPDLLIFENKYLIVVYREINDEDGFVITSFLTSKINYFKNKNLIWEKTI